MRDGFEAREIWPFECLNCLHVWEEEYVVRHMSDDHGNEVETWLRSGVTVQPPWSDACCPGCGAFHVTSFPRGYLAHHPELGAEPEFRADLVSDVGAAHDPRLEQPRVPTQGAPTASRLLVALGVPLALFVGYELYENIMVVRHHH